VLVIGADWEYAPRMSGRKRLLARLREVRTTRLRNLGAGHRGLVYLSDLARHCAHELKRDRAPQLAAALTYRTLFSLLPTLALALVVLQVFVGPEDQVRFKQIVIEWVLSPLQPEEGDAGGVADAAGVAHAGGESEPAAILGFAPGDTVAADAATATTAARVASAAPREEFADAQEALGERIEQLFDALGSIDFGSIGLVGLLLFLWAATGLLTTVEHAFDAVYAAHRRRRLHHRLPLYYTMITLGPIVLLAGLYLRTQLLEVLASGAWTQWLAVTLGFVSPLLTAWILLFAMFVTVPNTRVALGSAAVGALTAAVGVGLTAEAFRVYVSTTGVTSLYGALALLPLFLFWLYLLWLVVLFGLEVSYALQTVHGHDWREAEMLASRPIDDAWAVPVAVLVARAFDRGELLRVNDLATALELPRSAVLKLLGRLEEAGVVREVDSTGNRAYALARPPHRVGMAELLDVTRPLPQLRLTGEDDEVLRAFLVDVHRAGLERAGARTLHDFLVASSASRPAVFAQSGPILTTLPASDQAILARSASGGLAGGGGDRQETGGLPLPVKAGERVDQPPVGGIEHEHLLPLGMQAPNDLVVGSRLVRPGLDDADEHGPP
jgi:membrane protein